MWLYSSLENPLNPSPNIKVYEEHLVALLARVKEIEVQFLREGGERKGEGAILIGSLNGVVCELLEKIEKVTRKSPKHVKFLFKVDEMPEGRELPAGMVWSQVGGEGFKRVLSRTSISYQE